jgi:hypothetical protein
MTTDDRFQAAIERMREHNAARAGMTVEEYDEATSGDCSCWWCGDVG